MKRLLLLLMVAVLLTFSACDKAETPLQAVARYITEEAPLPYSGCEWAMLAMRAADIMPKEWPEAYAEALVEKLDASGGSLGSKNTEYSKAVLALTAAGYNAADIKGHDLTLPLADFEQTTRQGLNGAIFALLAFNCGNYQAPQGLKESYLQFILSKQLEDGGFALSGNRADADFTAMAVCALSAYREDNNVANAIEAALNRLSQMQKDDGGFASYGTANAESCAQVILALTCCNIKTDDARFVKNGRTVPDALMQYRLEDGSFSHVVDGETTWISTQQAFMALAALERAEAGLNSIYAMGE